MHVEVDDGLVAGRGLTDQPRQQRGELGAVGQLVDRRRGAHQVRVAAVELVVGRRDGPAVDGDLAQVVQGVLAVVPLDEHGEHRLARRHGLAQPLAEEPHDALGDGGQRVEPGGALGAVGQGVDLVELVAHRPQHRGPVGVDQRLVEPAEPHAAREVADDREAQLGGGHQTVEQLTGGGLHLGAGGRLDEPALQDRGGHRDLGRRALLGQEDAEDRVLELLAALDAGDAVVGEHALEPPDEVGREAAALGVEGLQVGVEVLAGAVHAVLDVRLLADRPVAAQLGEVGEDGEQVHLVGDGRAAGSGQLVAGREVAGQGARLVAGVEVVAQQHRRQVGPGAGGPLGDVAVDDVLGQVEVGGVGRARRGRLDRPAGGLEPGQRGTGLDLAAGGHVQLLEPRVEGRRQHGLHLHALEHEHRGTGGHLVTHRERAWPPRVPVRENAGCRPRRGSPGGSPRRPRRAAPGRATR